MRCVRSRLLNLFTIDLRSLALLRVGLAVSVLADVGTRALDLVSLYSDRGVLPRDLLLEVQGREAYLSVHYWASAHPWLQGGVFAFTAAAAVALLVGWRTRAATLVCWYLVASLQVRLPFGYFGGDTTLRMLLFWALFVPLAARFSLDAARGRVQPRPDRYVSGASAALLLQVGLIYWITGIRKSGELWWSGQAVFYALQLDEWATPLGVRLRPETSLLEWLTYGTLGIELLGPFLAFVPFWNGAFRLAAVASFWAFHAGLAACMSIGLFPLISMVAWLPFVPTLVWERLGSETRKRGEGATDAHSRWASFVALALLAYIVVTLAERSTPLPRVLPDSVRAIGTVLRLHQSWAMFSPDPPPFTARYDFHARLSDGSYVTSPVPGGLRWTVFFSHFEPSHLSREPVDERLLRSLGSHHCAQWNEGLVDPWMERVAIRIHVRTLLRDGHRTSTHTLIDVPCPSDRSRFSSPRDAQRLRDPRRRWDGMDQRPSRAASLTSSACACRT